MSRYKTLRFAQGDSAIEFFFVPFVFFVVNFGCTQYRIINHVCQMTQRILFFGMEGVFSRAPLLELINAHHTVCAIIVPRPDQSQPAREPIRLIPPSPFIKGRLRGDRDLPLVQNSRDPNIIGMAWHAGIDVYEVSTLRNEATIQTIHQLNPDLIVVACFPHLLPSSLFTVYSSLNLHPSLLPNYRGPSPLFWIFHDGLEHAGVTIHLMDEHADTGDIIAQERVQLPDAISYADAEKILSERAAQLLIKVLGETPHGRFARTPQPRTAAPRAPNPSERDYVVTRDWTVRRAFNFIRGIGEAGLEIGDSRFAIEDAMDFTPGKKINQPISHSEKFSVIQFADGTVTMKLSPIS